MEWAGVVVAWKWLRCAEREGTMERPSHALRNEREGGEQAKKAAWRAVK